MDALVFPYLNGRLKSAIDYGLVITGEWNFWTSSCEEYGDVKVP